MIIMLCSPARAGKDTIADMYCDILKERNIPCNRYMFAKDLKDSEEKNIREKFGVSVWDDTKKHLFRQHLIDTGIKARNETNGRFLIDKFLEKYSQTSLQTSWVISDFRFIDEYHNIIDYVSKYGTRVVPIYIERYIEEGTNRYILEPSIPEEVKEYSKIRKIAKTLSVRWEKGWFWNSKLKSSLPYPL